MGIGAAIAGKFLASKIAIAVVGFLIDVAISYVISSILTKSRGRELSNDAANRKAVIKRAVSARRIIYGQGRYGGAVVFEHNTNQDKTKNFIVAHCSHEVESFDQVFFDDETIIVDDDGNVTNSKYVSDASEQADPFNVKIFHMTDCFNLPICC